jgi:succinate-semialdehyde dehydrogenase / glutarate-semialdehyde dehydrogenase
MSIQTINPATGDVIQTYEEMSEDQINGVLDQAKAGFEVWRKMSFDMRATCMKKVAAMLKDNVNVYAEMITKEMGKPITQSRGEILKCAWVCEYFADKAADYLKPEIIKTEMTKSFVTYQPQGTIFSIMPWNFPFWQVFRFAAPNLMAGNVGVLSHAPISTGAAIMIQDIFKEAGFPEGVFTSVVVDIDQAAKIIADPRVFAVTLTGSERAGKAVGANAAGNLKKVVLELGGSDPYVVLKDADLEVAAQACITSRLLNAGQVCISAKRLIVEESIYDAFKAKIIPLIEAYQPGDPMSEDTNFGPMARSDLRDELERQVQDSIAKGADCLMGGKKIDGKGFYFEPTLLENVKPGMPAYDQELFGPVVSLIRAKDEAEALRIANDTPYGLGAAVFTQDLAKGEKIATEHLNAGICAVNTMVGSDPRLPFGGVKLSGYGRECAADGIREFMNVKTVTIK